MNPDFNKIRMSFLEEFSNFSATSKVNSEVVDSGITKSLGNELSRFKKKRVTKSKFFDDNLEKCSAVNFP